jgi:hypothetical protein
MVPAAEHGVEGVAASSGQRHQGLVVAFAFAAFPVVVVPAGRILERGEGGEKQDTVGCLVAPARGVIAADGGPERQVTGARSA